MIIDTHCHVYGSEMQNAEEIIRQALENDMHLILNGTDLKSNAEVLRLAGKYENAHAALGYFYTLADDITDDDISLLDSQLGDENVVAVGEGLRAYFHQRCGQHYDFCASRAGDEFRVILVVQRAVK